MQAITLARSEIVLCGCSCPILGRQAPIPETTPLVGEWKLNPDYGPPAEPVKPWSERHPKVLYWVLGVAVVGMGTVTVRFLMKVRDA